MRLIHGGKSEEKGRTTGRRPTSFEIIYPILPDLSHDEMKRVISTCQTLMAMNGEKDNKSSDVLTVVYDTSKQLGLTAYWSMVVGEAKKNESAAKVRYIEEFFAKQTDSRAVQLLLLKMAVKMLVEHLRYAGAPVTPKSIIQSLHLIPSLLDRAFPGYASIGMLKHVVGIERRV